MPILPLPQFEADLAADRAAYAKLKPPSTIVVRFGAMKMVGEFPYSGDQKPGCGSKIVVRTHRGVEIGEMLTSTCPNAGCSKSVTRQEMLEYIENSGGSEYPFFTDGRALRVATVEDLQRQSALDGRKRELVKAARERVAELGLPMKIVEAEPILGGESLTFYFAAEQRVDFRDLVRRLAEDHRTRIELRQVGARDEARLTADYERCGQHCCCKQFLKVLKPVSMRSAKVQKSTLDPLKISGRCGRLMCCLRYEDETYETLRKKLPNRSKRVGTPEGPGRVVDTQILTQLVLVELEADGRHVAVPVEQLGDPGAPPAPRPAPDDPLRGLDAAQAERRTDNSRRSTRPGRPGGRPGDGAPAPTREQQQDAYRERARREERDRQEREARPPRDSAPAAPPTDSAGDETAPETPADARAEEGGEKGAQPSRRKKRRRWGRRRRGRGGPGGDGGGRGGDAGGGGGGGDSPGS